MNLDITLSQITDFHAHIFENCAKDTCLADEVVKKLAAKYSINNIDLINPINKTITKKQILELQKKLKFKNLANPDFYIINDAELMHKAAYNAILKFLEEPQSNIIGIFVTSKMNQIPDTIKSRCLLTQIIMEVSSNDSLMKEECIELEKLLSGKNYNLYRNFMEEQSKKEEFSAFIYNFLENYVESSNKPTEDIKTLLSLMGNLKYNVNNNLLIDEIYYRLTVRR